MSVHLYQPDTEVPCYLIGYIPLIYLKLYPENALRIKFVKLIWVCICICRELQTQAGVCVHTPYVNSIDSICARAWSSFAVGTAKALQ